MADHPGQGGGGPTASASSVHHVGVEPTSAPVAAPAVDALPPAMTTAAAAAAAAPTAAAAAAGQPSLPPLIPPAPIHEAINNNNGDSNSSSDAAARAPVQQQQQQLPPTESTGFHHRYSPTGRKRKQRTSGVWRYFEQFTPVAPKGRNVRCTVLVEAPPDAVLGLPQRTVRCGATYTHVESRPGNGGSGTSGMLHHLLKKHPLIHAEIMGASPVAKARRSEGLADREHSIGSVGSVGSGSGSISGRTSSLLGSSSAPGTALARLRESGLGSDGAPPLPPPLPSPLTAEDTLANDRRLVLMCALQTLDPTSLDSSLGFRLFLDGLSPGYAASRRHSPASTHAAAANATLRDLSAGVRQEIAAALKSQCESCRRLGWAGPFVGLQVDSTGMGGGPAPWAGGRGGEENGWDDEVCTASVSFVPQGFDGLVRLAIGARCFRGRQASDAKKAWIRELTAGLFAGICGQSEPRDVYLAATLGGCSGGDGGGSFRRTLEDMGIPVLVCSSHRLHSAVARSLGGCGGAVDSNGAGNICGGSSNGEKCANGKMRDVVRRAVSMVEIFQHWGPPEGGSSAGPTAALETVRAEVEELAVALTRTRRANARWTESHALFDRLLRLAGPLMVYFRSKPSSRSLHPSEWQAIREAASILEPALEVGAKVHAEEEPGESEGRRSVTEALGGGGEGGDGQPTALTCNNNGDGGVGAAARAAAAVAAAGKEKKNAPGIFLAESIELHANLHCSFIYPLQDIRTSNSSGGEGAGAEGNGAAAGNGAFCSQRVADLTPEAQALLGAVAEAMEDSGLGRAREDTEAVSMLLDPRFKQCCASTCVDGGNDLKLRALTAVTSQLRKFKGPAEASGDAGGGQSGGGAAQRQDAFGGGSGGGGAVAVSRLDKMRQAQKMEAEAAAARGDGSASFPGGSAGNGTVGGRLAEDALAELREYMLEPAGKRHELLPYWKLNGTDTRDSGTGQVVLAARWPHLALLARLYAGVDSTSRQAERHFVDGGRDVGVAVGSLQRSGMPSWRIEQMLLVRLNKHLVPEVVSFSRRG